MKKGKKWSAAEQHVPGEKTPIKILQPDVLTRRGKGMEEEEGEENLSLFPSPRQFRVESEPEALR